MSSKTTAILSAVLLAGFLLLRPVVARLGAPTAPDVHGRSTAKPPAGVVPADGVAPAAGKGGSSTGATTSSSPLPVPVGTCLEKVEQAVFDLTNEERRKAGREPLKPEGILGETARAQSSDMIARRFFNHINPDGLAPEDRVAVRHRRLIGLVGENIWQGSGFAGLPPDKLAREIVEDWMKSPGHKENILRPDSTHLGVGVCGSGGEVRATQNFARILAYLDQPLPVEVPRGTALSLAMTPVVSPARTPEGFDLWDSDRGLAAGDRTALAGGRADAAPGIYRLRIYFSQPEPGRFSIVPGPQIDVR